MNRLIPLQRSPGCSLGNFLLLKLCQVHLTTTGDQINLGKFYPMRSLEDFPDDKEGQYDWTR